MRFSSTCWFACLGVLCLSFKPALADGGAQFGRLLPNDGAAFDDFSYSVGISGTIAIVGARGNDDDGSSSGSAYLFDTLSGIQTKKLLAGDGAAGDRFGHSVAISGGTAIVGAYLDDDNGDGSGSAYLFDTLTGVQMAKLLPSDGVRDDAFGWSVAISGTTAIVSALLDDDNGDGSGSAYLFDTITGVQIAKLLPGDGAARDQFGWSVAISGSIAIVGAKGDDDNGSNSGSAYLFDVLTGRQVAKLLASDGAMRDGFGRSVAISGGTAIVGAPADDDNGVLSGSAYLFDTLTGAQTAKLLAGDGAAGDQFGNFVAISGSIAIVSSRGDNATSISVGSAYLFDTLTGGQTAKLLPSGRAFFGISVAISGTSSIVGARFIDDIGIVSGSAFLFDASIPIQARAIRRNGSELNSSILSRVTDPVLGSNFVVDLDCTGHSPSFAVLRFNEGGSSGLFVRGGEVLIDLASVFLFSVSQAHTGGVIQFSIAVPNDPLLCGLVASVQGVVLGAPGYELANALDLVIGL